MWYKSLIFSLFLLFFINCGYAQDFLQKEGFGVEANLFEGKVLKHTVKFLPPIPALSTGVDVNFVWKTNGKKDWQQRRRYPTIGIGLAYTNYGIDSIYGRCFSIYPNILIPLITGNKLEWTLRIGDGFGYVTKHYTRISPIDTINNAIGSHGNDYASFNTDIRYHINNHWDVQIGGNFSHISNASYHQPNLGVNLYGTHIGFRYFPVTSKPKYIVSDLKPIKNRWGAAFRLSMAFNQPPPALGPTYPVYIATGIISKKYRSKNKVFSGIDYSYHESIYAFLRNNPVFVPQGTEAQHAYKTSGFIGNEFLLGRVGVVLQLGYYLHQAYQVQGVYYEKLGGNLYLSQKTHGVVKDVFLCAFLKANSTVAEYAELGFGLGF